MDKEEIMSNKVVKEKAKLKKRENADKKANQKKLLIIGVVIFIAAVAGALLFIMHKVNDNKDMEVYSYHGQTVQLFANGKYSATLAHNVQKSGTYTKANENGRISISFNTNGRIENGWIINNSLHIPAEWDDGHGHGNIFPNIQNKKD